jgi:hypothetical protein
MCGTSRWCAAAVAEAGLVPYFVGTESVPVRHLALEPRIDYSTFTATATTDMRQPAARIDTASEAGDAVVACGD